MEGQLCFNKYCKNVGLGFFFFPSFSNKRACDDQILQMLMRRTYFAPTGSPVKFISRIIITFPRLCCFHVLSLSYHRFPSHLQLVRGSVKNSALNPKWHYRRPTARVFWNVSSAQFESFTACLLMVLKTFRWVLLGPTCVLALAFRCL